MRRKLDQRGEHLCAIHAEPVAAYLQVLHALGVSQRVDHVCASIDPEAVVVELEGVQIGQPTQRHGERVHAVVGDAVAGQVDALHHLGVVQVAGQGPGPVVQQLHVAEVDGPQLLAELRWLHRAHAVLSDGCRVAHLDEVVQLAVGLYDSGGVVYALQAVHHVAVLVPAHGQRHHVVVATQLRVREEQRLRLPPVEVADHHHRVQRLLLPHELDTHVLRYFRTHHLVVPAVFVLEVFQGQQHILQGQHLRCQPAAGVPRGVVLGGQAVLAVLGPHPVDGVEPSHVQTHRLLLGAPAALVGEERPHGGLTHPIESQVQRREGRRVHDAVGLQGPPLRTCEHLVHVLGAQLRLRLQVLQHQVVVLHLVVALVFVQLASCVERLPTDVAREIGRHCTAKFGEGVSFVLTHRTLQNHVTCFRFLHQQFWMENRQRCLGTEEIFGTSNDAGSLLLFLLRFVINDAFLDSCLGSCLLFCEFTRLFRYRAFDLFCIFWVIQSHLPQLFAYTVHLDQASFGF